MDYLHRFRDDSDIVEHKKSGQCDRSLMSSFPFFMVSTGV